MEQFRGRCGRRGNKGRFIIQTSQPEHPIYQQISNPENISVSNLLAERKDFDFPPYTRIIELTVRDKNEARADKLSAELASTLGARFNSPEPTSLLASPSVTQAYKPVVDRIEDFFIRKIRICFKKDRLLSSNKADLKQIIEKFEKDKKYTDHISIDVDPS
jgi:primosomal protein N' (replication factor Y)